MEQISKFERFAAEAREGRELATFARATRTLNDAEDILEPRTAEAERVVAALEAMFLVLHAHSEDEAVPSFRQVLHAVMNELEDDRADDLIDALTDCLDEEGLEIRMKGVGEALADSRPFAEQAYKLCLAIAVLSETEPGELEELMADLAQELDLDEGRAEALRSGVEQSLRGEAPKPKGKEAKARQAKREDDED